MESYRFFVAAAAVVLLACQTTEPVPVHGKPEPPLAVRLDASAREGGGFDARLTVTPAIAADVLELRLAGERRELRGVAAGQTQTWHMRVARAEDLRATATLWHGAQRFARAASAASAAPAAAAVAPARILVLPDGTRVAEAGR